MKRLTVVLVLSLLAAGAFALDLSAGVGPSVGSLCRKFSAEQYLVWDSYTDRFTTVPWGLAAFFDATYGQAAVGLRGNGTTHEKWTGVIGTNTFSGEPDDTNASGFLSVSVLGKYPFALGKMFTLFPLLGIEYDLNLWLKDQDGVDLKAAMTDEDKADLNQFWFKGGVGADVALGKSLSLRAELLLGFKLLSQAERDRVDSAQSGGAVKVSQVDTTADLAVYARYTFASVGAKR